MNIFTQSLSGLEIIMNEINESIIHAVTSDFRYGISNAINEIIESSQRMEKEVREEQHFDSAAFIYATLNQELKRLLHYYTSNENELFANTMMGWANLAGLKGQFNKNGVVRFNENSFSIKSAENSMLIPPNWMEYVNRTSNAFSRRVRELYEERTGNKISTGSREIVGTFNRELSIENDYLHFFAPGDEVFDCIVDNAMNSYKGTCTAFALEADFDWRGIVYTWNLYPNEQLLLENGIPLTAIRQYKGYVSADQVMSRSVKLGKRMCWSEMFFNSTYSMVSEYCAGCDNHKNIVESDPNRFELVKKIPAPTRKFSVELNNMFASSNEAILFADSDNTELIGNVINRGFSTVIINDDDQSSYFNLLNSISEWTDVNLLGMNEFVRLVEHGDYYFFAGDAVVLYGNKDSGIYKKISRLRKSLQTGEIRLLHVFKENIFCNEIGKTVSSIVDGPVLEEYLIERM